MGSLRFGFIIAVVATLTACGGGSFATASTNACLATSAVTVTPGGGTMTFPTFAGASATLKYAADSSIPAATSAALGTTTCFSSLATPQPGQTLLLAFTVSVNQSVDLLSQLTVTLPTGMSPSGNYEFFVYSPQGDALSEIFPGVPNGATILAPSANGAIGIIMNPNQPYVIEVLQTTAPPPPPP